MEVREYHPDQLPSVQEERNVDHIESKGKEVDLLRHLLIETGPNTVIHIATALDLPDLVVLDLCKKHCKKAGRDSVTGEQKWKA